MRMTNMNKEAIIKRAISHAFDKEEKGLSARAERLALRCYNAAIPAKVRKALAGLPEGWIATTHNPHFNVCGLSFDFTIETPVAVKYNCRYDRVGAGINDDALKSDIIAFQEAMSDFRLRKAAAAKATRALVNSVTTFNKLIELWPEGKKFVSGVQQDIVVTAKLPAIPIPELNKMLGLGERKAA